MRFIVVICRRGDSNPHELPHTPLKRARLPVPPLRLKVVNYAGVRSALKSTTSALLDSVSVSLRYSLAHCCSPVKDWQLLPEWRAKLPERHSATAKESGLTNS